ncbi:fimbrial protein [Corticimicrobacter populi]|uniref:Fimbrial-type adhesion domain-containing protein n=1 Tax=Corticimicrobacter populi TaxID=2175229 RepID=A0A2V1K0J8_9BURK|nr:fimbrial protein [Corticimicrobacter populi]PWF22159.1 hypothetical protein DD235_12315 [Corticimicrobacter populi]
MRLTRVTRIRMVPALVITLLGMASQSVVMNEAYAGPLDSRAVACRLNNQGGKTNKGNTYTAYRSSGYVMPLSVGVTTRPLPSEAQRGQVLFSTTESALPSLYGEAQGQAAPLYYCPPGTTERFDGNGAYIDSAYKLYSTGVPGIGYRVYYYLNGGEEVPAPATFNNSYQTGALVFPMNGSGQSGYLTTRIDFVATGQPIQPGVIRASQVFGQVTVPNAGISIPWQLYKVYMNQDITITVPTCNVTNTAALNMTLPDVSTTQLLSGKAGGISETVLQVSCAATSRLAPSLKITANTQVSGQAATLRNQDVSAGGAKGVGVKLWLYDPPAGGHRQVSFGTEEKGVGLPVGNVPTSQWTYGLGASYQQIDSTVQAGTVRASATLTFTYM